MKSGPIVLIDDDIDDQEVFTDIVKELGLVNALLCFDNCEDAFHYLVKTTDQPFVIFCDVNLPGMKGTEFKRQIDADPGLRRKSIPFIFHSTAINQEVVNEAYTEMTVQGFFQKKNSYDEIRENIRLIVAYWKECHHPNTR